MGAGQSSASFYFGSNGFAPPSVPQPMELDPGAMVTQSGRLRDQSAAIYSDTTAILNRTIAVAEGVERNGIKVEGLKRDADLSASSSLQSALMAKDYLNDTMGVYSSTRSTYNRTKIAARDVEMSRGRDIDVGMNANDMESLQREISMLAQRLDALERRIYDMENREKA